MKNICCPMDPGPPIEKVLLSDGPLKGLKKPCAFMLHCVQFKTQVLQSSRYELVIQTPYSASLEARLRNSPFSQHSVSFWQALDLMQWIFRTCWNSYLSSSFCFSLVVSSCPNRTFRTLSSCELLPQHELDLAQWAFHTCLDL